MPDRRRWRFPWSLLAPLLLAAVLFSAWSSTAPPGEHAGAPAARPPAEPPLSHASVSTDRPDAVAAAPPRELAVTVAAPAPPTFEQRVDELVAIGRRTAALAEQDDSDGAAASDREARERFSDLMGAFADAGERALDMVAQLPEGPPSSLTNGRRIVLQLVLGAALERADHDAAVAGERTAVDALVQATLDVMPGTAVAAEVGEHVLARQRFLRLAHEPTVLALVRLAATEQFPRSTATTLLLTLWDNLQAAGERSSEELSRLALLALTDADPSQRTASCRQLLRDPRYRGLVLAWLRERGDRAVAAEVASLAARELPVADALVVLRELAGTLPRAPTAYLALAHREPDAVADGYRELLAANTHANVRCDLVTGVGMVRTPLGRELAELALHGDPAVEVRLQALFALTAQGDAELGERALGVALDDPRIGSDPVRLAAVVMALGNLEASGDANAIDRIAQRLRTLPLADESRQRLDALVRRAVPGQASAALR
jgi:hypothetical protein